jgi:hypothetical protein
MLLVSANVGHICSLRLIEHVTVVELLGCGGNGCEIPSGIGVTKKQKGRQLPRSFCKTSERGSEREKMEAGASDMETLRSRKNSI